jgi:hypothetical protein
MCNFFMEGHFMEGQMKGRFGFILVLLIGAVLTACGSDNDNALPAGNISAVSTYSVIYNGNGATGGSVPTDSTNYLQGQTVTVLGNTGNLVNGSYT